MNVRHFDKLPQPRDDGYRYIMTKTIEIVIPFLKYKFKLLLGEMSDGATFARDLGVVEEGWRGWWARLTDWLMRSPVGIITYAWWVHDQICRTGKLPNGEKCSNLMASLILMILLIKDKYYIEAIPWFVMTLCCGGGEARKNGMFWVRK